MPSSVATRGLDDLALAVYLERLFHGRRVLWLGDASSGAPDRAARVAATVLAADPRAIADHVERENLSIVRLSQGSALPAGPYDVVVVPDLPATGLATPDRLRQLAGALAHDGVLVVASSNGDAAVRLGRKPELSPPTYDTLYDLLTQRFPAVRMLGQAPFVGYAVADFSAAGDPAVVFDGSLLGDASETPERFIALCGAADVVLDAYSVVQIPARSALAGPDAARPSDAVPMPAAPSPRVVDLEAQLRESREQLDAGNVHAEGLEATLSQRTGALADLDGEVERLRMELRSVRDESDTRVAALRIAREELDQLRAAPASPSEDYGRLELSLRERGQEILELRAEVARRATLVRDLVEELRGLREGRLLDETSATADAERRLGEAAARLAQVEGQLHALRADREAAVQRALRADAERTEAGFRADEALGRLAQAAEVQARADEERTSREAQLSGFVRGLRARAAELQEQVELARAASEPAIDPNATARSERELEQLRGERAGLAARLDDREAALSALQAAMAAATETAARAQRADLSAQLAAAGRADALEADVRRLAAALGDTRASLVALGASIDGTSSPDAHQTLAGAIEGVGDVPDAAARGDDEEVRRLHDALGAREAELLVVQNKLRSAERETRAVRDAVDQARTSLEELLARATSTGDASSADHIGAVLRVLSRV